MQVTKNRMMFEPKKAWFRVVLLIILWLLIYSMYEDYQRIRVGFDRKSTAEALLELKKEENQRLLLELSRVSSLGYREKLIREKLNMQKAGEVVVVLPEETIGGTSGTLEDTKKVQNWQKWLNLIYY